MVAFRYLQPVDLLAPMTWQPFPSCQTSVGIPMVIFFDRAPNPKAFAISEDGHCGWASDYGEASFYALNACAQLGKPGTCRLYRVNDNVVWPMQ